MHNVNLDRSCDVAVVGGGIVGLATAEALTRKSPGTEVAIIEKEAQLASHQTGRNSGVIHSGIYYKPGSLKAEMSRNGAASMVAFCEEHDIAHEVCGKLIVATETSELPGLQALHDRGLENGLAVSMIDPAEARETEPNVACIKAVRVPSTGIADYSAVAETYARLAASRGATLHLDTAVERVTTARGETVVETNQGAIRAGHVINCGGLHSDRIAVASGMSPDAKIVPFRGEYFELVKSKHDLVRTLIYPVPNPEFPFLGVHLTKMVDGGVHAGPNAVLALAREGYAKTDIDLGDLRETLTYPGFLRLARKYWRDGAHEVLRSMSKKRFVESLQRLVPAITADDLITSPAGIRAQALLADGGLVDDFLIEDGERTTHVLNAPSPAATASLEIGAELADRVLSRVSPS
jgi:L-2-hydroxyglutarate oxidase